jgi:hypothetical protein
VRPLLTAARRSAVFLLLALISLAAIDSRLSAAAEVPQLPAPSGSPDADVSSLLALPPRTWAADAATNELATLHRSSSYLRYRMLVHDDRGSRIRDVIESKDGTVARIIQKDDRPLTPDEDKAERDRLTAMLDSPASFARHVKSSESNKKLADDLIRLMPDAMIYTYAPGQPQAPNHSGLTVVMDYEPNPKFNPPTTTSEALKGLKGRVWIDAKTRNVVRMEGTVFQPVNLGWGILAHIYPGGEVLLEQTDAGNGRWIYTHFTEKVSVRALMMKTLNVHDTIDADQFHILPNALSYQEAIRMLLDTPLPTQ